MFTSRLPKSTSARRPSNPNDGSTSVFGTHIPVSVRKANLFTPQPKRSLQTGLSSTSRKSYLNTDKKYQQTSKPAPDRDEQLRMFERLVEFLKKSAPGFPIPEAKRFFSSVSTTETSRLFEFLIGQLLPQFKINRLEIDVPEALASLDYPYIRSVTKSALVSITTRQAIVNLLVIFDWLIESIEQESQDIWNDIDLQQSSTAKMFFDILKNPDATNEEMFNSLRNKAVNSETAFEELNQLEEEIQQLRERVDELEQANRDLEAISEDLKKREDYIAKMTEYCAFKEKELEALKEERLKKTAELENKPHAEDSASLADVEARQQIIASLMEESEKNRQAVESEIERLQVRSSQTVVEIQKAEREFTRKMQEYQAEIDKLTRLRDAARNSLMEDMKNNSEADKISIEILRGTIERLKQEAIAVGKESEEERDRYKALVRVFKENNKISKKVSKRINVS